MTADPQKERVYAWEDSFWGWDRNLVRLKKCREVIRFACGLYGVDPPSVKQHHTVSISWSMPYPGLRQISLQAKGSKPGKGGLNYPVALHEASHQIVYDYYGSSVQDHGPQFVGVYVWLLSKAGIASDATLYASLNDMGITWQPQDPALMPEKPMAAALLVGEASRRLLVR